MLSNSGDVSQVVKMQLQPMLIIRTPLGDAIRSCDDVVDSDSSIVRLKPEASCTFLPEPLLRSSVPVSMYASTDLPNPYRTRTEISNVCGFVAGDSCCGSDNLQG